MSETFKLTFLALILLFTSSIYANAITPEEYCQIHKDAAAPGTCTVNGNCAVLITNLGTEECKLCEDGGCTLTDCSNCEKEE